MSHFAKKPAVPAASQAPAPETVARGEPGRKRAGRLPIGRDPAAMAVRLRADRDRMIDGDSNCCVMICAPERMRGLTMEEVLAKTANRFANSLRAHDSIFHYGEDRVLVCVPFVKAADAPGVMQRLRDLAGRKPVDLRNGTSGHITIAVGGAMMDRETDVLDTIARADKAMEQGRLSGNRTCLWTPDLP
jgi:hypothetical protein